MSYHYRPPTDAREGESTARQFEAAGFHKVVSWVPIRVATRMGALRCESEAIILIIPGNDNLILVLLFPGAYPRKQAPNRLGNNLPCSHATAEGKHENTYKKAQKEVKNSQAKDKDTYHIHHQPEKLAPTHDIRIVNRTSPSVNHKRRNSVFFLPSHAQAQKNGIPPPYFGGNGLRAGVYCFTNALFVVR